MVVNETTKFSTLSLQWASHDNCIQRAGRVGRVANGRVYRLVPADFYNVSSANRTSLVCCN
jgi:ATP-dependent RNA helicase TDRD9